MSDRPDYTLPVSIEGVTIETLPIDIKAQTLGVISIDIVAQSLGEVNVNIAAVGDVIFTVNIAASAVTLDMNIIAGLKDIAAFRPIINPGAEDGLSGWRAVGNVEQTSEIYAEGAYSWKLLSGQDSAEMHQAGLRAINTDYISAFTVWAYKLAEGQSIFFGVKYSDGDTEETDITPPITESWEIHNINYTAGKKIVEVYFYAYPLTDAAAYVDFINLDLKIEMLVGTATGVNLNVDIKAATAKVGITINAADITGNIPIDIKAQTLGTVSIAVDAANVTGNIPIDITAQTVTNLKVDINAQSLSTVNIAINSANVTGNIPIDIKAQTVGNIGIDIVAQTLGTVAIDIKAQTVDINIKTSGGVNIIIDKLTQTAYTERRSIISNRGETALWYSPTADNRTGKFFPRGCRGFIANVYVYCKDIGASGGTVTVYITPHPSMGTVSSGTVTVPAAGSADFRAWSPNIMWNYDSCFIFCVCSTSDIKVAYDAGTPYDEFVSSDAGVTWTSGNNRYWLYIDMKGETVGDIPVSGIVNTIEIPSTTSARQIQPLTIPAGQIVYDTVQYGAGELLVCLFHVESDVARDDLAPRIKCDGEDVLPIHSVLASLYAAYVDVQGEGIYFSKWNTTATLYTLMVTIRYPFKRSLEIGFYNAGAAERTGYVAYSYKKIS